MKSPRLFAGLTAVAILTTALNVFAADWPQWRGPDREDRSPDTGLLKSWPQGGPKALWVFKDAGLGYAGYSIVDGTLFTMGLRGEQEWVIAVRVSDGTEVWATPAGKRYENGWGDGPRCTPTVSGNRVYAIGGRGGLVCLDRLTGRRLWEKSLVSDLGGTLQSWGYTESPLVIGNRVYCTPGGSAGTMAALDAATGAVVWRSKDLSDSAQYSSAIQVRHGGRDQVVQLVEKRFFGLNPETGVVLWSEEFPGRTAVIPTPIHHDGVVYVTAGYGVGCKAVQLGGAKPTVLYENNKVMKNHHGGVVRVGEHLYGHSDGYAWVCQELKTGKEVWADKSLGKGAIHFADGMLYCVAEDSGEVALVEASPRGWSEKSRFKLSPQSTQRSRQGRIWTHPVVLDGRLFLRDQELLHCYDVRSK